MRAANKLSNFLNNKEIMFGANYYYDFYRLEVKLIFRLSDSCQQIIKISKKINIHNYIPRPNSNIFTRYEFDFCLYFFLEFCDSLLTAVMK